MSRQTVCEAQVVSIGTNNGSSIDLDLVEISSPRPPEAIFPLPALLSVIGALLGDAHANGTRSSNPKAKKCKCDDAGCGEHGIAWNQELTNLSMCCVFFRENVWKRRIEHIVMGKGEDFDHLERMIPLQYRSGVR